VVAFTGYGNVSQGAQEILGLLPVKEITPEKLLTLHQRKKIPDNLIYKVVFHEEDLVERTDGRPFDLQEYYQHPELYRSKFEQYLPHISMLINCVYWDLRYPRFVPRQALKKLFSHRRPKLTVIGDISCDVEGSVECTLQTATIEKPIYVYDPFSETITEGAEKEGMLVMAVDILPAELPRDASENFGDVLINFIKPIADADFDEHFDDLDLPRAIKKGLILHNGALTPEYTYLEKYL
jgi:alpha-aminoadipic semialdehyde synthase